MEGHRLLVAIKIIRTALLDAARAETDRELQSQTMAADASSDASTCKNRAGRLVFFNGGVAFLGSRFEKSDEDEASHQSIAEQGLERSQPTASAASSNRQDCWSVRDDGAAEQRDGDQIKPNLPLTGESPKMSTKTKNRVSKHLEQLKGLLASGENISLSEIHRLLHKRIFIHIGADEKRDEPKKRDDPTFLLLCKGSCSSGQAGLVMGHDAEVWAQQLLARQEALWRLSPVDAVAMAIPSSTERTRAISQLLSARGALPLAPVSKKQNEAKDTERTTAQRARPWWVPPDDASLMTDASIDTR